MRDFVIPSLITDRSITQWRNDYKEDMTNEFAAKYRCSLRGTDAGEMRVTVKELVFDVAVQVRKNLPNI